MCVWGVITIWHMHASHVDADGLKPSEHCVIECHIQKFIVLLVHRAPCHSLQPGRKMLVACHPKLNEHGQVVLSGCVQLGSLVPRRCVMQWLHCKIGTRTFRLKCAQLLVAPVSESSVVTFVVPMFIQALRSWRATQQLL